MIVWIIGMCAGIAACLVAGSGWAAVTSGANAPRPLEFLFRSAAAAIGGTSLVWAWVYPLGGTVSVALPLYGVVMASGYALAIKRGNAASMLVAIKRLPSQRSALLACAAIASLASLPQFVSVVELSVAQRIGPDANGYAIAANALAVGQTNMQIRNTALDQAGGGSVTHVISPKTRLIDTTPSFSVQVAAEFLTGAHRWGFPGAAAMAMSGVGRQYSWTILGVLGDLSILVACLGAWSVAERYTRRSWLCLVAAALIGLNGSILNSWQEGAIAGAWVLPGIILICASLLSVSDSPRSGRPQDLAIGLIMIVPAYNDALYPLVLMAVAFVAMSRLGTQNWREWWVLWRKMYVVAMGALVIVAPSTIDFARSVVVSLHENSSAGWWQPRWASIGEAVGIGNPYGSGTVGLVGRSPLNQFLSGAANGLVAGTAGLLARRQWRRPGAWLMLSGAAAALAVYLDTRYLQNSSNYQYFKAISMLAPAWTLGAIAGVSARVERPISGSRQSNRQHRTADRALLGLMAGIGVAVIASGVLYGVTYRREGGTVPLPTARLADSSRAASAFHRYNILAPGNSLTVDAVGASVDLNWIERFGPIPRTRLVERLGNPIALLVLKAECPDWRCLHPVRRDAVVLREDGVALVRLAANSRGFAALAPTSWDAWASKRFEMVGGRGLATLVPG